MDQKSFVGNDSQTNANQSAPGQEGGDEQVNPGAIRKSTTQSLLNALSNASGTNFTSVEDALKKLDNIKINNYTPKLDGVQFSCLLDELSLVLRNKIIQNGYIKYKRER
jgi:hypothetical protein